MAGKSTSKPVASRASTVEGAAPPSRVRVRLKSIDDVKVELARLYREVRNGKVDSQAASRMANMLSILGRLIEGSDLEARLDALERPTQTEKRPWPTSH